MYLSLIRLLVVNQMAIARSSGSEWGASCCQLHPAEVRLIVPFSKWFCSFSFSNSVWVFVLLSLSQWLLMHNIRQNLLPKPKCRREDLMQVKIHLFKVVCLGDLYSTIRNNHLHSTFLNSSGGTILTFFLSVAENAMKYGVRFERS